jgi:hypothetical protein
MSVRDTPWPPGTPCWVDLTSPDPDAASAFYAELFGWEIEDTGADFGHYRIARKGGHRVGGIGSPPEGQPMPASWNTYLASADVDATAAAITAAGGTLVMPPADVGPAGRMLIAVDPGGAGFGVWQAGQTPGSEVANEPGAFTWNECMSRDFEAAKAFYSAVFDYEWTDIGSDGFVYETFSVDGRAAGGLGAVPADAPAEMPSAWMAYFSVEDAAAACEQVIALGGSVVREPWDTPFGTMAVVTDPSGASFCVAGQDEQSRANAETASSGEG